MHRTDRGFNNSAAGVAVVFSGRKLRLFPDHPLALDFTDLAAGIGDDPVSRNKLCGNRALVFDSDRVGKNVAILIRLGLVRDVLGARAYFDLI